MVNVLGLLIDSFDCAANRTRCFAHIANLIAKAILKLFDIRKSSSARQFEDADATLQELTEELDVEDVAAMDEHD